MDDFEAFRKKRKEEKQAQVEAKALEKEQEKSLGWVDGLGPAGPKNPKVKGFVLGRYTTKKVDPKTLERPKGYEKTSLSEEAPGTERDPTTEGELKERPRIKGLRRY